MDALSLSGVGFCRISASSLPLGVWFCARDEDEVTVTSWLFNTGMYFDSSKKSITQTRVTPKKMTHHHHIHRQPCDMMIYPAATGPRKVPMHWKSTKYAFIVAC